jgi:cytochrome oxidase assembly protein ShyY1
LTRRWLVGTLLAVLFGVACFYLGLWQWHRHEDKQVKVDAIARHYDASPVPLEQALAAGPLTPERQWTRVTLRGTYAPGSDLLVRNRTLDQTVGFEVLTPLSTDGHVVLVDRGWVPNAQDAETTPPADPAPAGEVAVTGWLRTDEPSLGRDLPHPQLASIDLTDARAQVPALSPLDWYVVLGSQQPAASPGAHPVRPLPRPEEDLGPHQAYAYQWWLFMPGGVVFVWWAMRRELLLADSETEDGTEGDIEGDIEGDGTWRPAPGEGSVGHVPVGVDRAAAPAASDRPSRPARPAKPARPRKVRIWDEEDA